MSLRNSEDRWGGMAKTLHWLIAVLIVVLGCVGLYMSDLPNSPQKLKIFALHKSVGLTVLALVLLRIAWRLYDRRPADVPMPRWQALAAHAAHAGLYVLMLVLPLSGWLFNSAAGFPLQWFGLFNLPSLTGGRDDGLRHLAIEVHESAWWILVAILVAHAGAALKHHFLDRDDTLRRMWPFGLPRRASADAAPTPTPTPTALPADPIPPDEPSKDDTP